MAEWSFDVLWWVVLTCVCGVGVPGLFRSQQSVWVDTEEAEGVEVRERGRTWASLKPRLALDGRCTAFLWRSSSKCVLLHVLLLLYALCMPLCLFTALVGLVLSARMVSVGMLTRSVVERGNAYAECRVFQMR